MNHLNIIIIGGGAAGIMAALSASRTYPDYRIAIFDRTFALGRKILVCGAGRCNVTNINLNTSSETKYYGAGKDFVQSVFHQFSYERIVEFFKDLGVELYVERKTNIGKLFPVTDQARTVTSLLEDELAQKGVEIFLNQECTEIKKIENLFNVTFKKVEQNGQVGNESLSFTSEYLIISAGGKTYPALGSNGSGYRLAETLGHTIITPVVSAVPLVGKNPLSQEANGTKLEIEATSIIDGKEIKTTTDDVMFTQYGLSGPAILNISREISIHLTRYKKNNAFIRLNFFPGMKRIDVEGLLRERWRKRPSQTLELSLNGLFPPKLPPIILKLLNINIKKRNSELKEEEINKLINLLTNYTVPITDTRGWNEGEFTAGGVSTQEIKTGSLESKIVPGLYFCGEIVDVDGDVGGFNLSWAWSSGYIAGMLK